MIFLLDNTVLSNFALAGEPHLLEKVFGLQAATTVEVMGEFDAGVRIGRLPETSWSWLAILSMSPTERTVYRGLLHHLDSGEASCLAIAMRRPALVLTDDRRARKLAAQRRLPISGTIGILVRLVRRKQLSISEGNALLTEMIAHGYRAHIKQLDQLVATKNS